MNLLPLIGKRKTPVPAPQPVDVEVRKQAIAGGTPESTDIHAKLHLVDKAYSHFGVSIRTKRIGTKTTGSDIEHW